MPPDEFLESVDVIYDRDEFNGRISEAMPRTIFRPMRPLKEKTVDPLATLDWHKNPPKK